MTKYTLGKPKFKKRFPLVAVVVFYLSILVSSISTLPQNSEALSGSDFNPGRIIDNSVFYNANAMSLPQIQTFLNSKVPVCDTQGAKMHSSGQTRAQYGAANGEPAPYTCLKDYRQNTTSIAPESGLCGGYAGRNNETAAQIIYKVARSCGINPQVILVMLQKEQGLVTDDWPWKAQYKKAMGAFCPDTAACNPAYAGFFYQVYYGAHRFKVYAANQDSFNYRAGRNNSILWHPNTNCGRSTVYIQNQATAGLYIYTPYRPNQAALKNLYSTGDSCSSYGNRNFWRMFHDWFGSTTGHFKYVPLETPRWMRLNKDTKKRNLRVGIDLDHVFPENTEIYFDTKILIGNEWYLRTAHDTAININYGIPLSDIEDFTPTYSPMSTPRWMQTTRSLYKREPITQQKLDTALESGSHIFFDSKTTLGGDVYLRSKHDTAHGRHSVIPMSDLENVSQVYTDLDLPRTFRARVNTYNKDPFTDTNLTPVAQGAQLSFDTKIKLGSEWYLRTVSDTANDLPRGVPLTALEELPLAFEALGTPRWLEISRDTYYKNPRNNINQGSRIRKGTQLFFTQKILIGGTWYLRTNEDESSDSERGIVQVHTKEVDLKYSQLKEPRWMQAKGSVNRKNPVTGANSGSPISDKTKVRLETKVLVGGIWYLRTTEDTAADLNVGFRMSDLDELPYEFVALREPRKMRVVRNTFKKDTSTGANTDIALSQGQYIYFSTKTFYNGQWYLRTSYDTTRNNYHTVLITDLDI